MSRRPPRPDAAPTGNARLSAVLAAGERYLVPTGAPPPFGKGSGFLYVVTSSNVVNGVDLGPSVLMIKETKHGDSWNAPGGETDKTDDDARAAALREFNEETAGKWHRVTRKDPTANMVLLSPKPQANEVWALFVDLDAQVCEDALYKDARSGWTLNKRMHTYLSKETGGYAFVPIAALLAFDHANKTFKIGPHAVQLRFARKTLSDIKQIRNIITKAIPPPPAVPPPALAAPAAPPPGRFIELHAVHLRVMPPPHLFWGHVKSAADSQGVWGGLHVTITGFAIRKALAHLANTPAYKHNPEVHGDRLSDYVKRVAAMLLQNGNPWRPKSVTIKHPKAVHLSVAGGGMHLMEAEAKTARLAKVKDAKNAHISIGNSKWLQNTLNAVTDPMTRWQIGIAVAKIDTVTKQAQVVRFNGAVHLWP